MEKKFKVGDIVKIRKKEYLRYKDAIKNHGVENKFKVVLVREYKLLPKIVVGIKAVSDDSFYLEMNPETLKKVKPKGQIINPFISPLEQAKVCYEKIVNEQLASINHEPDKNKYEVERDSVLGHWLTNVIGGENED